MHFYLLKTSKNKLEAKMQNTKKGYIGYFIYNIFKDVEATTNPQQYQYFLQ